MTAMNFPDLPALNDIYTAPNGVEYQWDGSAWNVISAAAGVPGPQGEVGPPGLSGEDGKSAYEVAVENNFIGTEQEWLDSLQGADGVDGIDGKSAYEVAVENGFIGTEPQWLDSLKGSDGDSAYEVAISGGYIGTEAEWVASLKGEQGVGLRYVGRVATEADLSAIANPVHGDIYIVEDTGNAFVYNSVTSSWDDAGPIVGADGPIGPQGVAGPTAVSTDADNAAYLGTDKLVYVPKGDGKYLPLAGGQMTGLLGLTGSGTTPMRFGSEPAGNYNLTMLASEGGMQWQYNATPLLLMGKTTLTAQKPLILSGTPTFDFEAVNKKYVDDKVAAGGVSGDYLPLAGGVMTGGIDFPRASVTAPYSMKWNTTLNPSIVADDSFLYFDVGSNTAFEIAKTSVNYSLPLILKGEPALANEAANKKYVDDKVAAGGGGASVTNPVAGSVSGLTLWVGTQAQYNAIATKDAKTVYNITA